MSVRIYTQDPYTHDHHFTIDCFEVPALELLETHPPHITEKTPMAMADVLREQWTYWWKVRQPKILHQIFVEAIAAKLIKPLKLKEPK